MGVNHRHLPAAPGQAGGTCCTGQTGANHQAAIGLTGPSLGDFLRSFRFPAGVEKCLQHVRISRQAGGLDELKAAVFEAFQHAGCQLSGGQQQRLCIARTIAVNPEVILMDEPCSALDPIATARIEDLIDELRESYAICIVTHSMQQAARVSQRTAYFHLGDLVEVGDTNLIFTNPRAKLTEDYITGRFG